jgi:hypothetical protein
LNFGRIPALLIWSNMWKKSSRALVQSDGNGFAF